MSNEEIPKSLVRLYEEAFARGTYLGSLENFLNVRYLLFRMKYLSEGREPPTRARWLRNLVAYQKQSEGGE